MTTQQPPFAVRVVLTHEDGTTERVYVRGNTRMGKSRFAAFALGDLLLLTDIDPVLGWDVQEVPRDEIPEPPAE